MVCSERRASRKGDGLREVKSWLRMILVLSPGDLTGSNKREGVCSYLAVCRSLGLTRMCPFLEVGSGCIITPSCHAATLRYASLFKSCDCHIFRHTWSVDIMTQWRIPSIMASNSWSWISLCRSSCMRVKGNPIPIGIMELTYDARYCKPWFIGVKANWQSWLKLLYNRGKYKSAYHLVTCK